MTTSCSNLRNKSEENLVNLDVKLISKLELIQKDLQMNKITSLKDSLDVSLIDRYKINKLSEFDLSKVNFYFTKPEIQNISGKNTIGFRFSEEIFYFDVEYKYSSGDWKITKFTERR